MHDSNLLEAFASYRVRPVRRGRSVMTPDNILVISCRYTGFKSASLEILQYEEDLTGQTNEMTNALRAHLAEAKSNEYDVRVVVAIQQGAALRTTYYARKDLVGRVTWFDGDRFVIEFRRTSAQALAERRAG